MKDQAAQAGAGGPAGRRPAPHGLAARLPGLRLRLRAALGLGTLPNTLIIGAMKCGTTSLFDYLVQHPQVCGARTKELHYFDSQHDKGARWYRANFACRGEKVVVESSPYYFFHPLAPARAAALVPDARLILLLRNPADRAYSHYNQNFEEGLETLSFEEALACEAERLAGTEEALVSGRTAYSHAHQTFSYAAKGLYAAQIERWLACFPRERLLIGKAEELFRDPQAMVDKVTDFLGIERHRVADLTPGNQRRYPLMHPETRRRLEQRFEAPNRDLARFTDIGWTPRPAGPLAPAEIDLASPHMLRDPHPAYARLREIGPVVYLPRQQFWLAAGHRAVAAALARPDLFSSAPYRALDPVLAGADPPAHDEARASVARCLTPARLAAAEQAARDEAVRRLAPAFDGVTGFARPVARAAAGALVGLDADAAGAIPGAAAGGFEAAAAALARLAPRAALHRALIDAAPGRLDGERAASLVRFLWLTTASTVERVVAWSLLAIAERPGLAARLAGGGAGGVIEEVIRLHPPEHMILRRTTREAEVEGVRIPAGAAVMLCVSAANRDPALFDTPDRLVPERAAGPHLSFGAGPHVCPAAAAGRRIVAAALAALAEDGRVPRLAGEPDYLETVQTRALARLPLRARAAGRGPDTIDTIKQRRRRRRATRIAHKRQRG